MAIYVGDYGYSVKSVLLGDDGKPYDPSSDTLVGTLRKPDGTEVRFTPTLEEAGQVKLVVCTPTEGMTDEPGRYMIALEAVNAAATPPRKRQGFTDFTVLARWSM